MWDAAGLLRDGTGLRSAVGILDAWSAVPLPTDSIRSLEDRNLLALGRELVLAASARTESVGAHARSDDTSFPGLATAGETREVVSAC
jgi:L-aspartate oxidase